MFNFIKKLFHLEEQTSKKEKIISSAIFFFYIFLLGYGGSGGMNAMQNSFYASLIKPEGTPPNWVFPIVWTVLFILIGLSAYYVWNHYKDELYRKIFVGLYAVNGLLVFLWPYLFFAKNNITGALYMILVLIVIIELMILAAFRVNHKSAYLLIPYLLWVFFATYLNTSFIVLNS